jgi:hypothetical protein
MPSNRADLIPPRAVKEVSAKDIERPKRAWEILGGSNFFSKRSFPLTGSSWIDFKCNNSIKIGVGVLITVEMGEWRWDRIPGRILPSAVERASVKAVIAAGKSCCLRAARPRVDVSCQAGMDIVNYGESRADSKARLFSFTHPLLRAPRGRSHIGEYIDP